MKWKKLERVEQLTCIQEAAGLNPAGEHFFFENRYFLHTRFLKSSFDSTVTSLVCQNVEAAKKQSGHCCILSVNTRNAIRSHHGF